MAPFWGATLFGGSTAPRQPPAKEQTRHLGFIGEHIWRGSASAHPECRATDTAEPSVLLSSSTASPLVRRFLQDELLLPAHLTPNKAADVLGL